MDYELVISPYSGKVEEVLIFSGARFYEWDPLFLIKDRNGSVHTIKVNYSGTIHSLEVQSGDLVVPGMVLAYLKEDSFVTGSD